MMNQMQKVNGTIISEGKNIAIIAYITLIGLIVAFVMNSEKKNTFAQYHIRQVLGLAITGFSIGIIGLIPFIGWIISILASIIIIIMWIMGLMNAINEKEQPVPIMGTYFEKWFQNI